MFSSSAAAAAAALPIEIIERILSFYPVLKRRQGSRRWRAQIAPDDPRYKMFKEIPEKMICHYNSCVRFIEKGTLDKRKYYLMVFLEEKNVVYEFICPKENSREVDEERSHTYLLR